MILTKNRELGELMNSLKLFPFMEREQILSDINKAIVPGVYGILNNRLDNLPITDWFVLIVISWRYYVCLLYTSDAADEL